jgi:predicted RNA polymerase sigma factor
MSERGDDLAAVFRRESGRCTATLIRVLGDVDLAEDAVAEAFTIAAEVWPRLGTPPNPGAWITITARNRAIDRLRREASAPAITSPPIASRRPTWNPIPTPSSTSSTTSSTSSPTTSCA